MAYRDDAEDQEPEVEVSHGSAYYSPGDVDEVPVPEDKADDWELFTSTPIVNAPLLQYCSDVVEPGYRVTADDDATEEFFNEEFLPNAGIIGGERHKDFQQILFQAAIMHVATGDALVECVKRASNSDEITGFMSIKPHSVRAVTEKNKPVLLPPDATGDGVRETPRGEAAAYLQYHSDSVLGRRGHFSDTDVVPLSQNDVIKISRNVPPGEIWGQSAHRPARDRIRALKQKLRDNDRAIQTKAYGIWSVAFQRDLFEVDDPNTDDIFIEWDEGEQKKFIQNKVGRDMGPGDIIGHDGTIEFQKFEGEVAQGLLEFVEIDIKLIISALPTPLYAVGFEENVNQFVVERQERRYHKKVSDLRRTLEAAFLPALETVAEQREGLSPEGLDLSIEADEEESPILSLDEEEIEKLQNFASALAEIYGSGNVPSYLDDEIVADLVLQLPEEATQGLEVDPAEELDMAGASDMIGDEPVEEDTPPDGGGDGGEAGEGGDESDGGE